MTPKECEAWRYIKEGSPTLTGMPSAETIEDAIDDMPDQPEEEARTVREGTRALRIIFRKLAMIFVMTSDATDFDYRACCRTICERCGREFGDHAWDPREPWVTILCDGRRVKL